jgi:haloalkane dehalogenase
MTQPPHAHVLRTPESAFADCPGFDFPSRYLSDLAGFDGYRVHLVDVQAPPTIPEAPTFLCLHGNPSWSYLYRKMIPVFATSGRVVAPDLLGFGKSDKPTEELWHTFTQHRNMLLALVERLDLKNITLVVQDWGGLLGLTLPMAQPERYSRLLVMNTALATGTLPSEGFVQWRSFSNSQPDLNVGKLLARGKPDMTRAEADAYNAPFPDASFKAALRQFPNMLPETVDADGAAISRDASRWWKTQWNGATFMAVGAADPVLGLPQMQALGRHIRGCPEPYVLNEGGHFLQEWGEPVARAALAAWK